ncbi:hypothetical protein [Streptomyces sp. NPDC059008]|uniref:hypothetical protein n=1 Tax=Streptomyces sp. NPDC059008 TaxID=3346693 RepID=UPI00367EF2D7
MHDGQIVVGGGGYEQPFAQWDLHTGAVLTYIREAHGGVARTSTMEVRGRSVFITGDSSAGAPVRLWDPARRDSVTEWKDENWLAVTYRADPVDVCWHRDSIGGLASGQLGGRPVVVSAGADARVMVRNADGMTPVVEFGSAPLPAGGVGPVAVGGRTLVVAAGGTSMLLGDPGTGAWSEPVGLPGDATDPEADGICCMDAGVLNGRPLAVTGARNGLVCLWDLHGRGLLGDPVSGHTDEVVAVRIAELHRRAVMFTAGRDGRICVWGLDQG